MSGGQGRRRVEGFLQECDDGAAHMAVLSSLASWFFLLLCAIAGQVGVQAPPAPLHRDSPQIRLLRARRTSESLGTGRMKRSKRTAKENFVHVHVLQMRTVLIAHEPSAAHRLKVSVHASRLTQRTLEVLKKASGIVRCARIMIRGHPPPAPRSQPAGPRRRPRPPQTPRPAASQGRRTCAAARRARPAAPPAHRSSQR